MIHGINHVAISTGNIERLATFHRDPDGNVVELLEAPADSALAVVG